VPGSIVRNRRSPIRSAFTVIELMLVIAIVGLLAAMAMPELQGPLARQRLKSAGEQVRAAWANARSDAITTGEIHLFRFDPGTSDFAVQRWAGEFSSNESAGSSTASDEIHSLPQDVTFAEVLSANQDARADYVAGQMAGADTGSASSVMFYPDGTTSTIEVSLTNQFGDVVVVSLRGMTGVVKVEGPYNAQEMGK
jgi:type II secretion system protein H